MSPLYQFIPVAPKSSENLLSAIKQVKSEMVISMDPFSMFQQEQDVPA